MTSEAPAATEAAHPRVSVIVPLYNKRATIARAIDSILAQTFNDFDVLVVDDGSTDGSAEFVESTYADPRIRLHRQANAGPAAARNNGARLTRGELLTFLDADDRWRPDLLKVAVATLDQHPNCAAFTANFYREPEGVTQWGGVQGFTEGEWRLAPTILVEELRHCLGAFHPTTSVYRREVVERYGGFYAKDRCSLGEDVYLWIQIALNHTIYRHVEPMAHYHMDASELGIGGRKGPLPLEPVLTDTAVIRERCPPDLSQILETWLALHAMHAAYIQLDRGDVRLARWLIARFPEIRTFRRDFAKLQVRALCPAGWRAARKIAGLLKGRAA